MRKYFLCLLSLVLVQSLSPYTEECLETKCKSFIDSCSSAPACVQQFYYCVDNCPTIDCFTACLNSNGYTMIVNSITACGQLNSCFSQPCSNDCQYFVQDVINSNSNGLTTGTILAQMTEYGVCQYGCCTTQCICGGGTSMGANITGC